MIMCSKVNMSTAGAFNVRCHTLILNRMLDMLMRSPKVLYKNWYWFEVEIAMAAGWR